MYVSFIIVLSTLLIVRLSIALLGKQRRAFFSSVPKGRIPHYMVDPIALLVTVDQNYLNFRARKNNRCLGRLVVTENYAALSCAQGVIFRIENRNDVEVKVVGPERVVMLGNNPSGEISIRVEMSLSNEKNLIAQLDKAFTI
jgi:hypothetical protein